ncbi:DUF4912 domain-containing protein [Desulfofundulus sp.]|uniref:DUF4912 domain-containing protein n=1 Tax=Desulfofundulus sp. TaxID=2282750 RepID=UPI003C7538EC
MELPRQYNENRLVLMIQEPAVIFSYWELSRGQWESLGEGCSLFLRLYSLGSTPGGTILREVSLPPFTNDWYFRDLLPEHVYQAEIGYYGLNGEFYPLLRSNRVLTPRVRKVEGMVRSLKVEKVIRDDKKENALQDRGNDAAFWETYSSLLLQNKS